MYKNRPSNLAHFDYQQLLCQCDNLLEAFIPCYYHHHHTNPLEKLQPCGDKREKVQVLVVITVSLKVFFLL